MRPAYVPIPRFMRGWIYRRPYRIASRCKYAFRDRQLVTRPATIKRSLKEVDESIPRVMKRSTWAQIYFRRMAEQQPFFDNEPRTLTEDWRHDALEAIANAWGRLLAFVGLRR